MKGWVSTQMLTRVEKSYALERMERKFYIYIVGTLETLYSRHCVQGMSKFVRFLPWRITVFLRESRLRNAMESRRNPSDLVREWKMEIGFEGAFDYWKSCLRDCVDRKIDVGKIYIYIERDFK